MYTTANKSPHVNSRNLYIWWFPCSEIRWQLDAQCTATCAIVAKKMQSNNKTCLLHTGRFMAHLKLIYMAFHGSFTLFRKWYCDLLYIQTRIDTLSAVYRKRLWIFWGGLEKGSFEYFKHKPVTSIINHISKNLFIKWHTH